MNRVRGSATALLLAVTILATTPSGLWATSAVPEPGAIGIPVNPNASGTKLSGSLSIFYDIGGTGTALCPADKQINGMFAVLTLEQGNNIVPFKAAITTPFCLGDATLQVGLFEDLVSDQVVPLFFGCTAGVNCPGFQVKNISCGSNVTCSNGNGAFFVDIVIAVK